MLNLLGKVTKTILHTATLPLDVVKDAAKLIPRSCDGHEGVLDDTSSKLRKVGRDMEEISEAIDEM